VTKGVRSHGQNYRGRSGVEQVLYFNDDDDDCMYIRIARRLLMSRKIPLMKSRIRALKAAKDRRAGNCLVLSYRAH
jgi:uncharacterized protein YqjF (DUF2071 family)